MDSDLSEPCAGVVVLALMGITVSANLDRGYVKEARMKALANINNLTSLEVLYEDKHERYASTLEKLNTEQKEDFKEERPIPVWGNVAITADSTSFSITSKVPVRGPGKNRQVQCFMKAHNGDNMELPPCRVVEG